MNIDDLKKQWTIYSKGEFPRYVRGSGEWGRADSPDDFLTFLVSQFEARAPAHTSIYGLGEEARASVVLFELDGKSDLGNPDVLASYAQMRNLVEYLEKEHSCAPRVYFSGNRSFHVYADFMPIHGQNTFERMRAFAAGVGRAARVKDIDFNLLFPKHLIRVPYSWHEKSGHLSFGVDPSWDLRKIASYAVNGPDEFPISGARPCDSIRDAILRVKLPKPKKIEKGKGTSYEWIEEILKRPISDGRHRAVLHILAPYLMNVRQMDLESAYELARQYFLKCHELKPLQPSANAFMSYVKYQLKYAKEKESHPWRPETIIARDPELASEIGLLGRAKARA